MTHPPEPDRHAAGGRQRTCLVGALIALGSGIVLVAIGSLAAFLVLPSLIQGPLDLGARDAAGRKLPELRLRPLTGTGQPVTLEDLTGQVVVVNFWSTQCGPCLRELPHLARLQETFGARPDFRLLAVSCARGGEEDVERLRTETAAVLRQLGIDVPTYADPGFVTRRALDAVDEFRAYPTTLVMDRQGVIRGVWVGFDPRVPRQIEQLLARLLAEQ